MTNRLKGAEPIDIFWIAFTAEERAYLLRLAHSSKAHNRRLCLDYLESSWSVRRNRAFVLKLADELVPDITVRVAALELIGYFVDDYPQQIWPIVERYASHPNRHIRHQLAASVLEVLLAHHHTSYFPRVKAIVLGGDKRFLDTLMHCWPYGQQPKKQWDRVVRLIKNAGGDLSKVYRGGKYTLPAG